MWDIPTKSCLLTKLVDGTIADWFWLGGFLFRHSFVNLKRTTSILCFFEKKMIPGPFSFGILILEKPKNSKQASIYYIYNVLSIHSGEYLKCSKDYIVCIGDSLRVFDIQFQLKLEHHAKGYTVDRYSNRFAAVDDANVVCIYDIGTGIVLDFFMFKSLAAVIHTFKLTEQPAIMLLHGNYFSYCLDAKIFCHNLLTCKVLCYELENPPFMICSAENPEYIIVVSNSVMTIYNNDAKHTIANAWGECTNY